MGGKGGNDAPDPYQQSYRNPALDQLAQQDLNVKAMYQGPDPLVKTPGTDQTPSNQSQTGTTDTTKQTASSPPVGSDFGSYGANLSGLGDQLASTIGQDAPGKIVDDTKDEKTSASKTGQKATTTGAQY